MNALAYLAFQDEFLEGFLADPLQSVHYSQAGEDPPRVAHLRPGQPPAHDMSGIRWRCAVRRPQQLEVDPTGGTVADSRQEAGAHIRKLLWSSIQSS